MGCSLLLGQAALPPSTSRLKAASSFDQSQHHSNNQAHREEDRTGESYNPKSASMKILFFLFS